MDKVKRRAKALLPAAAAALLLALAGLMGLCAPVTGAEAAEYTAADGPELAAYMRQAEEGDTVRLSADIVIDLTAPGDMTGFLGENGHLFLDGSDPTEPAHSQTLDLAGHSLTIKTGSEQCCFALKGGVTLTVIDSSADKTGKIVGASNGSLFAGEADTGLTLDGIALEFSDIDGTGDAVPVLATAGQLAVKDVVYTPAEGGAPLVDTTAYGAATESAAGATEYYPTVDDAVAAADSGDTVRLLADSLYRTKTLTIDKSITLDLDAFDMHAMSGYVITVGGTENVTITADPQTITEPTTEASVRGTSGINVYNSSNVTIGNVTVSATSTTSAMAGVRVYNSTGVTLSNVSVTSKTNGVLSTSGASVTIDNSDVTVSGNSSAVRVEAGSSAAVANGSVLTSPYIGVWVRPGGEGTVTDSAVTADGGAACYYAVYANGGEVEITNSALNSDYIGLEVNEGGSATVTGGTITLKNIDSNPEYAPIGIGIGTGQGMDVTVTDCTIDATAVNGKNTGVGIQVYGAYADGAEARAADTSTYNKLTVNGGTITAAACAVMGNGARHGTAIALNGGTYESLGKVTQGAAIFHPQYGSLTLTGGAKVTGPAGIEMRAGTLAIEDKSVSVTATAAFAEAEGGNESGSTLNGVAIGLSQHTTNLPIDVTISDGTFTAEKGYAFYETDLQDATTDGVTATLAGGVYTGELASAHISGFVSGGDFTVPVESKYLSPDASLSADGEGGFTVGTERTAVAAVTSGGLTYNYATLADAFAQAGDGAVIKLIGKAELNERIQLKSETAKALTLDLNGQTLALGAGLGETSALWVGANVTLTIEATGGGTIDGTGMDDVSVPVSAMEKGAAVVIESGTIVVDTNRESCVYVKDGTLTINGGTFINECTEPYAYATDGSSPALTVNVYDGNTDGQYLIVNGGTFVGRSPLLGDTNEKVTGSYLGAGVRVGLNDAGQYVAFTGETAPEGVGTVYSVETTAGGEQNVATVCTADALTEALAGDDTYADNTYSVVRLGANIAGEFTIARSLTLDLNGFTLSSSSEENPVLDIKGGTEKAGTIAVTVMSSAHGGARGDGGAITSGAYVGLLAKQYADVTITGITVTGAHTGIFVSDEYDLNNGIYVPWQTVLKMSDCAVTGTEWGGVYVMGTTGAAPTTFIAEDSAITGGWYAVVGNGVQHNTAITLTDCTLTGTKGDPASTDYDNMSLGIYHPQEGTLTIDGGTVTGVAAGIEMRAGTLEVTGGAEITATSATTNMTPNDNGSTTAGAAIAVSQHTTNKPISVTLGEGTYTGVYALLERDIQDETTANVTLAVTGGTYNGEVASETCEDFVSGGKFAIMPAYNYFATDYHAVYNENSGLYETEAGSFVAAVGETAYATLADAVRAAASGSTITLIAKENTVEVNETLNPRQVSLTFDLNGKTILGGDIDPLFRLGNSNMTFKNGTIRARNLAFEITGGSSPFGRTITFAADLAVISENDAAVFIYNSVTLNTSADITAKSAAIMGNGTDTGYPKINIKGGTITSDTTALYLPQKNGTTTISGGTITGATGVEIRGGTLNINGGTIAADSDELVTTENNNGSTVTKGAAIAVSPYASAGRLKVNVTAGKFSGAYAFYEANLNPDGASVDAVNMTVTLAGGTYDGGVKSERLTGFISGGQYLAMPAEEYFDADYAAVYTDGYFTAVPSSALTAARLDAQTDVRAYAAQLGVVWADLAADDSAETGEAAEKLLSFYAAIGEAMTQGAVAEAKLAAFEAVDAYVDAFGAYKDTQLEALTALLGTEGEDGYVVLPTAAWAALREAGSRELFDFYLDKAKQEVNDIRAFRGDIKEQIGDLTDLQSALTDLSAALFGDADGTGAFSDLEKTLSNAITAAQTAIVGKGSSETLADLKTYLSGTILSAINGIDSELGTLASDIGDISTAMSGLMDEETLQQKLSDLSAAITTAQNALGSRLTEELGAAVESVGDAIESVVSSIDTALKDDFEALASAIGTMRTQLGSLTGALATEADELGDAIAAAQSDIDTIVAAVGALGTAGADDLATAITDITAGLGAVQTTVDSIAASVSASTAVESAKAEALTDIETWLTGYVDEILAAAPKASAGVMTAMAYTAETTDGDVYAKLREAFDEENAALVLRYYNEALASIDAALTVSDVTTAVSTFKAQVASVEAAAQNATTVSLTAVYVLLAVLLAAILVAIVLLLLKKQRPAPAPASDDAQPAPVQPAPAAPVSDTAAAAAASTDTANIAFVPDDTAATDDNDDKERVVIEASVRTFAEAYDDLDEEARKLFNDVVDYALGKEGTKEVPRSSGVCIKLGSKQVVKMTVRRGNPVALFVLENEMLKDFRRATNAQAKLKVRATELIIREEADLATAYTMVDLSVEQIKKDAEALKERRRAARRARRKARRAAETEDGGKEE